MRKYLQILKVSARNQFVYLPAFLGRNLFFFILVVFIFSSLWRAIYTGNELLAGLSMTQVLWYLTITEVIELSKTPLYTTIQEEVKDGTVAYALTRPYSYIMYYFFTGMGQNLVKMVPMLVEGFLLGVLFAGYLPGYFRAIPYGLILILGALALTTFWQIIIGILAFWFEEVSPFYWILQKLVFIIGGMFFPIDMFPEWLAKISRVSPFAFSAYWPGITVVNFSLDSFLTCLAGQLFYAGVLLAVSAALFAAAVKKVHVREGSNMKIIRFLKLAAHYFRFNLSAGIAYRGAFLTQVFGMVLNNSAFIVFWIILFERVGGNIKGYELNDLMFLWALATSGFGTAQVFMGNAHHLSRIIYTGELDVYLLQPKPVAINLVTSRMVVSGWGDMLYGIILFFATQQLTIWSIILFFLFSALMALVFTSLRLAYHSLTFFLGNVESLASLASEMVVSFMIYPGSIFKGPTVWLLHSLVPAALMAYIPARLIRSFDPWLFAILLGADLLLVTLSVFVFKRGIRSYESGNRVGTRV